MSKRLLAMALCMSLGGALGSARAEDLLQIYRDALTSDPTLASARASWLATQENVPQARAGLLPSVLLSALANEQDYNQTLHTDPQTKFSQRFPSTGYTVSASQPLYRAQNSIGYDQAKQQVSQSDYVLASVQQDLIVRVAQAYFNVLLAQFTIELTESQKAAVSENLAQAKRNFEVGTATITDTNDAQAKYDQIVAQEISVRNDLENALAALRAIIGRLPKDLKRFDRSSSNRNRLRPTPSRHGSTRRSAKICRFASRRPIWTSLRWRSTVSAPATIRRWISWRASTRTMPGAGRRQTLPSNFATDYRLGLIGVQLNLPIYQGGAVDSKVRQAIANQDATRQNLEAARRSAQLLAQNSFAGVTNGVAQVKALEQALKSAQVSYDSNKLGLEVGVRTNLDVLNQQQQVFQTRFNLAQTYYNFVINASSSSRPPARSTTPTSNRSTAI